MTIDLTEPKKSVEQFQKLPKAEEALPESRRQAALLADLLEHSSQAFTAGYPDGRLFLFNAAYQQMLGYDKEELLGLNWAQDLTPPEWREKEQAILAELHRTGRPVRYEKEYWCKDGPRVPVELLVHLRRDEQGQPAFYYAFVTDITERRCSEAALRESDQRVRQKLDSILSPEGDLGNLELADIIDVQAVQSLFNDFHKLTHFPACIVDLQGNLLASVGWQAICTNFHRAHPDTCKHCLESDTQLTEGVSPGEFKLYKCKNHMWDIATPIVVGGRKVGNLFSGQFFFEDETLDYDLFRSQAGQYGFNEAEYIAALERVPRLSRETVEAGMAFLVKLAHMLSLQSYSNLKLARSLTERDRLMETQRLSLHFLEIAHNHTAIDSLLAAFVNEIKDYTGCEAVGIRVLDAAGGISYQAYCGFSQQFYESESALSIKTDQCMCINVIKGDCRPELPFYTPSGSFYINGTTRFLATVSEEDKGRTRNVCNLEGYESVALIPIRRGERILGLIHVADRREDMASLEMVEMLEKAALQLGTAIERVQAQEALRESETRFRSLFDSMTEGVALHELIYDDQGRAVDYRIISTNPAFEKHTGLNPKEIRGQLASKAYGTGTAPYLEIYAQVAGSGEPYTFETLFPVMQRHFHVSATSPKQGQFVTVFEDITERQRMEEALRDNEQFLTDIFNSIQDGLSIVDPELNILRVNPAMEALGYSQPMVGRKCYEVYHGVSEPCKACPSQKTLLTGQASRGIVTEHQADGSERFIEIYAFPMLNRTSGQVQAVIEFARDVTEPRRAEQALAEEASRRRLLFEQSRDGIVVMDQNGKVYEANQQYADMLGYSLEEVHQLHVWDWDAKWTRQELEEIILSTDNDGQCLETVHRRKDGTVFDVEICANKVILAGQKLEYCVCRDISQRKQAEEERLRLSKLESLSTLAGGIAHDFNNILTAILGNIGLAMLQNQNEDRSRERLSAAEKACLQAQSLARQLLTFAKGGAPVKEPVAVDKLIIESASFTCRGSQVRSEFAFADDLWAAEADPGQINQVFQNLVINAIQAMPTGGTIKVRGENLTVEAGSDLPLDHGRYVKISVQDQGVGMPADYLSKIFDPYFTTKQKGSGLGLATAYSIVKNHHGQISVESTLGVGTVFMVYLPACDQKKLPPPAEVRDLLSGKGKILLMDDEEMVREVLGKMIGVLGYEAKSARDGQEAIALFSEAQESGQSFAAVILDLTVPGGMGGKEALEKLLKIDPQLKAIVSSGYSADPIMAEFEKYGFSGIIAKPYKVSELGKVLHKVINEQV